MALALGNRAAFKAPVAPQRVQRRVVAPRAAAAAAEVYVDSKVWSIASSAVQCSCGADRGSSSPKSLLLAVVLNHASIGSVPVGLRLIAKLKCR
jgi:hypothetical protein